MIIKSVRRQLYEARRENARLREELTKEKEITAFIGLLTADIDVNELYAEEGSDNE